MTISSYSELLLFLSEIRRPGLRAKAPQMAVDSPIGPLIEFLIRATRQEDTDTRAEALSLLARIVPPLAVRVAVDMLQSGDATLRWTACYTLQQIGDPWCEAALMTHLAKETDPEVRFAAISAFHTVGTTLCLALIEDLAKTDSSKDFEGRTVASLVPRVEESIRNRIGRLDQSKIEGA